MKNIYIFIIILIQSFYQYTQAGNIILDGKKNTTEIVSGSKGKFTVSNIIGEITTTAVNTPLGPFTELIIPGYSFSETIGAPKVPVNRRLIEIPYGADIHVNILHGNYQEISLADQNLAEIIPAQLPQIKDERLNSIFRFDTSIYQQNLFEPTQVATVDILGVMRGIRMGRLNIAPVQYNPVSKILRIYHSLTIEITFIHPDFQLTRLNKQKNNNPYFRNINQALFNSLPEERPLDTIIQYPVKYVIVSNPMFQSTLQPFVEWKKKKGYTVIEAYTDNPEVGSTAVSIKGYLQSLYNSGTLSDPPPSFVLLVGDVAQLPTFTGTTGSHPTDFYYCEYTGDFLPDAYYGRFSVINETQLTSIVNKTLQYEQFTMPDPSFLDHCVMIAGVDANYGPTHANGQINYGTSTYFNLAHELISHTYLYPASGSQDALIIQDVSNGCCYANYTAHGSSGGWADPTFTVGNIASLTNQGKYPLMVGNACLTNKFNDSECFGEALIRANNKGALGYIGASNNTYWNEDFWWAVGAKPVTVNPVYASASLGAYDRTFHDHGESYNQWFMTQGQMIFAGNLAVVQGGPSSANYYWEIYHLMGDPSLMVYFSQPPQPLVTYNTPIPLGNPEFTVTTEPYAYAAISQAGVLYGAAQANASGIAVISLSSLTSPGIVDIVVTGQNLQPFISTIPVESPTAPFCLLTYDTLNDNNGNSNGQADFGEELLLSLTFQNYGLQAASNVTTLISTSDPYVTLTDSSELYSGIPAGATVTGSDAYAFDLSSAVPDGHVIQFTVTISADTLAWISYFSINVHAPVLIYDGYSISDPDGNQNNKMDPGETAQLIVSLENAGTASALDVSGILSCDNPQVGISNPMQYYPVLPAGNTAELNFIITSAPGTPTGTIALFMLILTSNTGIYDTSWFGVVIGQEPVLIVNLDGNNTAAQAILEAIEANSVNASLVTALPVNLNLYESVFVCLGVYNSNHVLSNSEGTALASYLNEGGNLYLEGGDTWFYNSPTPVHPFFNITGVSDGTSDLDTLHGQNGTFTEGLHLKYSGDNSWIDRIIPKTGTTAFSVLRNTTPNYHTAVAYDGGNYKTIGASHEFSGLVDDFYPSTRENLMRKYLEFFGLLATETVAGFTANPLSLIQGNTVTFTDTSSGSPNSWNWSFPGGIPAASALQNPVITYNYPGNYPVSLVVTNDSGSDTLIKNNYISITAGTIPTISIGSYTGCGTAFKIPVMAYNFTDVAAISLMLDFDNTGLAYTGYTDLNPLLNSGMLNINQNTGTVYLSWISLVPISVVSDTLLNLGFIPVNAGIFPMEWDLSAIGNCELTDYMADVIPSIFLNGQVDIIPSGTPPNVLISATPGTEICPGTEIVLQAYSSNTGLNPQYQWLINTIPVGTGQVFTTSTLADGDIIACRLTSYASCAGNNPVTSNELVININQIPAINLGNDTTLGIGQSLVLTPGPGFDSYLWSTGETDVSISVTLSGNYSVTITDIYGCSSYDSIQVNIIIVDTLSGSVSYSNTVQTPLGEIFLNLKSGNILINTTESQSNGHFVFYEVNPGNYQISASCSKPWGGVNATDALLTMKHFVGMTYLSGLYLKAADVDNSNMVNALDALMIQKRSVGFITGFPAGDWIFSKPSLIFNGLEPLDVSVKGLCVGDVNGSHLPPSGLQLSCQLGKYGQLSYENEEHIKIPLVIHNDVNIGALSLFLAVPENNIEITDVISNSLTDKLVWNVEKGILAISWYSTEGKIFKNSDELLSISIKILSHSGTDLITKISLLPQSEIADPDAIILNDIKISLPALISIRSGISVSILPNPFQQQTIVGLNLHESGSVDICIYDISGRLIRKLCNTVFPEGNHEIIWNGRTENGTLVREGTYYLQLTTSQGRIIKPLIRTN
ncbi:MAG: C25 family cysteine peptidase [Bacteroidales bacterium]